MTDFTREATVIRPSTHIIAKSDLSASGVFGAFFAGSAWNYKRFYIALEPGFNINSIKFNTSNQALIKKNFSKTQLQITHIFTLNLMPGFLFTRTTLFFLSVGYNNAGFKICTTDTSLKNLNNRINGVSFGFGIKQKISQKFSLRLACRKAYYQKQNIHVIDTGTSINTGLTPKTLLVELSLQYQLKP